MHASFFDFSHLSGFFVKNITKFQAEPHYITSHFGSTTSI